MEHLRPFVITNLSATELEDIRLFGRMKVYAVVSISSGPPTSYNTEFTTHVDMEGNNNPRWNTVTDFKLHDPSLQNNLLYLNFNFHCRRTLGDKFIGRVSVPINSLLAMISGKRTASQAVRYPVMTLSGETHGFVHFCFDLGTQIVHWDRNNRLRSGSHQQQQM
ncbi:Protein SRC2 [Camellia lanceoleosa]|nr:Protein SRC2 [Camellia lanceoleosa]